MMVKMICHGFEGFCDFGFFLGGEFVGKDFLPGLIFELPKS